MTDRVNEFSKPNVTERESHDQPPKSPDPEAVEPEENQTESKPFIPDQRKDSLLETREELPEEEPKKRNTWVKRGLGFIGVAAGLGGGVAALWVELNSDEKALAPTESPKPSATASAFPSSSKAEIIPTTTNVTIETKAPAKETFPKTAKGIAEMLRLNSTVSGAEMPERLVGDFKKLLASVDEWKGEVDQWNSVSAIDPVKGETVYGGDAAIVIYREAIEDAYDGKNFYSNFVAQKVADTIGQVGKWESDGFSDIQKEATLLPTTINVIGDYPDGKSVQFSMQFRSNGIDPTVYPDEEANFTVGYNNIKNGPVGFVSQVPPNIVKITG